MRFSIILVLLSALQLNAQDVLKLHRTLQWGEKPYQMALPNGQLRSYPSFADASHSDASLDYLPLYFETLPLNRNGNTTATITNAVYQPLNRQLYSFPEKNLGNTVEITAEKGFIKKQPVAALSLVPLRKNPMTGDLEKLVEFDIEVRTTADSPAASAQKRAPSYASNSVLNSGTWYRIAVTQDGIYKIDYNFLKNLGVDVDNIDPRNLKLFGNGGGMLSEQNADFRHDDLAENSIRVVGESDGSFDPGDYILFYGQGPHDRWKYYRWDPRARFAAGNRFHHQVHLYSDVAYYFITTDLGPAKTRWTTASSLSGATTPVTSFDDYAYHELEEKNLIGSGREWFGDYFNFSTTTKTIPFTFPGLITSDSVYVRTSIAGRSTTQHTLFNTLANGQVIIRDTAFVVGTDYTHPYADVSTKEGRFLANGNSFNITMSFNNPSSGAEGWLNFVEVNVRRSLSYPGIPLIFRDIRSVGAGKRAEFVIQNANSNLTIVDVTDPVNVFMQQYTLNGSEARFTAATDSLREFIAFVDGAGMLIPTAAGTIANQNLHALGQPDMLIITHASLKNEADALANHHRTKNNLIVSVVDVAQIYNEFSGGVQDITGIRDFVRMFYVRAGSDTSLAPRFLLLFGDASYEYKDRVTNNTNFVPAYQSASSVDPTTTFVTDDYFGFLDENEGGMQGANYLDIAIGRLPARTPEEARAMVDKIIHYQSTGNMVIDPSNCADGDCSVFGNWRNTIAFVADDEDSNLHMGQADDSLSRYMETNHPEFNIDKIYLDAYPQQSTPGGNRYPDVNDAITRRIFAGALIMNYTGHGGVNGWAHERIIDVSGINSWNNSCKLPLFVTATCEFSRYDDPGKVSAGEMVLLNPNGGAIAMVTTTRLVYANANVRLNLAFLKQAFVPISGDRMPTMGEAIMKTKNKVSLDINNRKFVLLGDPAVTLVYPRYNVVTTQINDPTPADDTLKALRKITIKGEVRDNNNVKMSSFNGTVYPTIFDKAVHVTTLKNDGGAPFNFDLQKNVIYNGKASVTNGDFSFTFIVPKDIAYNFGPGKISYYSDNTFIDANGYSTVTIGGTASDFEDDKEGPEVDVFMNNEKFAFGGTTDENPILFVKLTDYSGINTVGTGIGHDITGLLDENTQKTFVLNEYYEAELDNYQAGEVRFPLSKLENGRHTMMVKAWDVHNNSSEGYTEFVVADNAELALSHVMNYPNPFTTSTEFLFEHNCPCKELFVTVKIMTVSGKVVKTLEQHVLSDGFRADGVKWDGLDEYGETIGRGVYVYKLNVRTPEGASAHEMQKLVILR